MKVYWTDRAKQRLKRIHDHIAKDSPFVAPQVVERIVRRSIQIGEFPQRDVRCRSINVTTCAKSWSARIAFSTASNQIASTSLP
jgi:plasmid stabilization system protein ParE